MLININFYFKDFVLTFHVGNNKAKQNTKQVKYVNKVGFLQEEK